MFTDRAPHDLRGTAFGIFNLISGIALLLASVISGILWNVYDAPVTFLTGCILAFVSLRGLFVYRR